MDRLFIENLDGFPLALMVLTHDMHLVITARDGEHVANLTPADLPQGHVLLEFDLFERPAVFSLHAVVLPNTSSAVLGATSNHVVLQANVIAPGNVAYPVLVLTDCSTLRLLFRICQLPKLDFVVISSRDESLGRGLELATSSLITA